MEWRITAPTSPVVLRLQAPPFPAQVGLVHPLAANHLPHTPAWSAWFSRWSAGALYITSSLSASGSFPTPPPHQALIGFEHDPAPQGGGGIRRTCAAGPSDPQVKSRNPGGSVCGQPQLLRNSWQTRKDERWRPETWGYPSPWPESMGPAVRLSPIFHR